MWLRKSNSMTRGKDLMSCQDVLWYMVFAGCAVNYMIKIIMNLVIVAMVIPRKSVASVAQCVVFENSTIFTNPTKVATTETPRPNITEILSSTIMPEELDYTDKFDWSEYEQGLLLGAFFWLYWASQVPGGVLGRRYGAKRVFGGGNFIASVITLMLPFAMKYHLIGVVILRCLQGFIMGFMYPSMHGLPAKWVPSTERSKFVSAYMGGSFGTAVTYPLCASIIHYLNWEAAFYITSLIGFIWAIMWCYLVYDTPHEHPRISAEELEFIVKNTPPESMSEEKKLPIPWISIVTSVPLLITIIAHWGAMWGFYTLLAQTPSYFNYIHGWGINMTGILSGIPHLVLICFAYLWAAFSDRLLREKKMSRTAVRKMATTILTGGQGLMIIGLSFSGCRPNFAVVFMVLGTAMNGAMSSSTVANLVDLSPNYAGVLLGIAGLITNMTGFISPMIVGLLTNNNQTIEQWRLVFLIAAANLAVGCVAYIFWGTSEEQPWNEIGPSEDTELGEELQKLKPAESDTVESSEKGKIKEEKPLPVKNDVTLE